SRGLIAEANRMISEQQAKNHVEDIRLQTIAVLAMNTMIGDATAERLANEALTSVSGVINRAIGIDLLI
ncbi:MAG: hypothetical protein KKF33_07835, partial [Alphaproteobacteria bacterium]|nr:hypothetical protein [Alphaproteobacteria bacterium]